MLVGYDRQCIFPEVNEAENLRELEEAVNLVSENHGNSNGTVDGLECYKIVQGRDTFVVVQIDNFGNMDVKPYECCDWA